MLFKRVDVDNLCTFYSLVRSSLFTSHSLIKIAFMLTKESGDADDNIMMYIMYCNYLVVGCLSKMAMFWKMWTHDQNSSPSSTRTYFHEPPD